jgi:hypothetical protein
MWPWPRASPALLLEMLRILMPLPVILASEILKAFIKSAAIGSPVTLHMLLQVAFTLHDLAALRLRAGKVIPPIGVFAGSESSAGL